MIVSIHNVYMYEMSVEFIFNGFTLQGLVQALCKGLQAALYQILKFTISMFHVVSGFGHVIVYRLQKCFYTENWWRAFEVPVLCEIVTILSGVS